MPTTKRPNNKTTPSNINTIDITKWKHLLIVESPAKSKTISKYLWSHVTVMASYWHIADLVKKNMGVEIENDFTPHYEIDPDKKKVVSALKKAMKASDQVRIATDEDREGEAIGWHVAHALGLDIDTTPRITFNEITKSALEHAVQNPRTLNIDLINAQQARRILDRLVGFQLSPLLWKKVRTWLSAGRVQSVAVRILVDREREIMAYKPKKTLKVEAKLLHNKETFTAKAKKSFTSRAKAQEYLEQAAESILTIDSVEAKPSKKSPSAPFTTSTLQQFASRRLWFSVAQTMRVAQKLYEAGHITYMRTDSIVMSGTAISGATKEIEARFGKESVKVRKRKNKSSSAQEAHECIRPTNFSRDNAGSDQQQKKLYQLIRQRALASQMTDAQLERTTALISLSKSDNPLEAKWEVIKEPGFLQIYWKWLQTEEDDDMEIQAGDEQLPALRQGQTVILSEMIAQTAYTRYPARYTEASLVKKLESEGIGRPSTYAPTIATILKRGYVALESRDGELKDFDILTLSWSWSDTSTTEKETLQQIWWFDLTHSVVQKPYWAEKKKLFPTDTGMIVNDFLVEHFPDIVDYHFTAKVESEFDEIAEGKRDWKQMLNSFYTPFSVLVQESGWDDVARVSGERILWKDPKTWKQVSVRLGRYGPLVQLGEQEDEDKRYVSLKPWLRLETISLEEALECLKLPLYLGDFEWSDLIANIGRFWPYVKHDGKFVSIPKDIDMYTMTLEQGIELIKAKRKKDAEKIIKQFEYKSTPVSIENGRYGPFIRYGKKNIKIPADMKKENLKKVTQKRWKEVIDEALK